MQLAGQMPQIVVANSALPKPTRIRRHDLAKTRKPSLPLLGERVRVRAGNKINKTNCKNGFIARPHPGLLPRGEGDAVAASVAGGVMGLCNWQGKCLKLWSRIVQTRGSGPWRLPDRRETQFGLRISALPSRLTSTLRREW